jgi:uncharacterized protein YbaA (DUF1428 family)
MNDYVDVFVLAVPKKNVKRYQKISTMFGKIMIKYGATEYREFIQDDLKVMNGINSFVKLQKPKKDEVVITAVIGYPSKKARDYANKNSMNDPAAAKMVKEMMASPTHDHKRMTMGGFKVFVNPSKK